MPEIGKLKGVGKGFFLYGLFAKNLQKLTEPRRGIAPQPFVKQEEKAAPARPFGEPAVHDLNHRFDSKGRIAQQLRGGHLFQFFRRFPGPAGELDVKRNKGIARVAGQQDYRSAGPFPLRDEILAAELVPTIGFSEARLGTAQARG